MASDVMGVRLHLRQLRVLRVLVDEVDELRVEVRVHHWAAAVSGVRADCPVSSFVAQVRV